MKPERSKYGFTLIEALAAVVVVSIGVVGTIIGFGSLSTAEGKAHSTELMQKLALDKYDELIATSVSPIQGTNGDFSDRNLPDYTWTLTVDTTSVTDLSALVVTVSHTGDPQNAQTSVTGLIYQPPTTTGGTGG